MGVTMADTTAYPTEEEINDVQNRAFEAIDMGETKFPGMTYEQGVYAAICWLRGNYDDEPLAE